MAKAALSDDDLERLALEAEGCASVTRVLYLAVAEVKDRRGPNAVECGLAAIGSVMEELELRILTLATNIDS